MEFAFDLDEDTADAIANEMMEDLSLSASEAQVIANKIRDEVLKATAPRAPSPSPSANGHHHYNPQQQQQQQQAPAALSMQTSLRCSMERSSSPGLGAIISGPLGAAPVSITPMGSARSLTGESAAPCQQQQQQAPVAAPGEHVSRRTSSTGMLNKSDSHTPVEGAYNNKPPSIHALIAAMKEVHEQERVAAAQQQKAS